jgi:hypothetical protein
LSRRSYDIGGETPPGALVDQPKGGISNRMPDGGIPGGFAGFGLVVVEVHGFTGDEQR